MTGHMPSSPKLTPQPCTRCLGEVRDGDRKPEAVNLEWLPCAVCGEPACADHAREYPGGWEHEDCHEHPLYSRYDSED